MSKTVRKFRGKAYRQGHEPCELELSRIRAERLSRAWDQRLDLVDEEIDKILAEAAQLEQEEMGYGKT